MLYIHTGFCPQGAYSLMLAIHALINLRKCIFQALSIAIIISCLTTQKIYMPHTGKWILIDNL
ncbi:hypothetical protein AB205_0140770 [Aquarana catesbeiana]|uniref:Uncharacterized protein n=1 Tax=Aquarana catesbeiana TaxID=8400 RepID=A0A2G9RLG1_AQUCT|nr:hypothetical protein AB205_0140770 [Aquarana catesbeiana]